MIRKYLLCEECYKNIYSLNYRAAYLWAFLARCESEPRRFTIIELTFLKFLESNKFIVSTDCFGDIAVKLLGKMETEEGNIFICPKEGKHD